MKITTKIGAVQMCTGLDVEANLREAERLVEAAAESGAGLVVLPESFAFMGRVGEDPGREQLALREQDGRGPLQSFLSRVARQTRVWLVGGTIPMACADPARVRAACLVFDDRGRRVARYDKIHLFDVALPAGGERYRESATIAPGDAVEVLDTPFGRLGLAVCYDLRFPELFRSMLDLGMEVLAIPAAFTATTGKAHWDLLVRARALENLAYAVAAAQVGTHANGRETHGHSMVVDPWGTPLAVRPEGVGWVCAGLDLESQRDLRLRFPAIHHRRLACGLKCG